MFKKLSSVMLAATLIAGAVSTASAAEVEVSENEVAANESSEISADSSSEVGSTDGIFYFDVASCGWKSYADSNKNSIFCHIYSCDGAGNWTAWQSKGEKCKYDSETGIATYDIQTGIAKGADDLNNLTSDSKYLIMFSTGAGSETYPVLMNTSCYGDTVMALDGTTMYENNVDSEKKSLAMKWKNSSLGTAKTITSTGKIQGDSLAYGETDSTVLASYVIAYYNDADKLNVDLVKGLLKNLNVTASSLMNDVAYKNNEGVKAGKISQEDADAINKAAQELCKKVFEEDVTIPPEPTKQSGSNTTNGNSSSNSSNSSKTSSSSKTSTTSNTVSSGQDSTMAVLVGGVMLAAAGVLFLSRKKREF